MISSIGMTVVSCTTTAQTKEFTPIVSVGKPYLIGGKLEADRKVSITINGELVVQEKVHTFTKSRGFSGEYNGKPVFVILTNVRTFNSSYIRADVTIGKEKAASLIF